jgi:hypothetical protein
VILVFAGAGASKGVDADAYPTTVEFFDRLPNDITRDALLRLVIEYVKTKRPADTIDIELVLWALDEASRTAREVATVDSAFGYLLDNNRLVS